MMKKTRSEWGFDDWTEFELEVDHRFNFFKCECMLIDSSLYAGRTAHDLDEAARISVEKYCLNNRKPLPWRPDFDLSTVEGCKEAIKECGYKVNFPYQTCNVSVIKIEDNCRIKCINVEPTLEQWQEAAQFAIDNHEQ